MPFLKIFYAIHVRVGLPAMRICIFLRSLIALCNFMLLPLALRDPKNFERHKQDALYFCYVLLFLLCIIIISLCRPTYYLGLGELRRLSDSLNISVSVIV